MGIDQVTLRSRLRDVEDALGGAGHAALVVYGNGSALGAGSRTHGYLRYLVSVHKRYDFGIGLQALAA